MTSILHIIQIISALLLIVLILLQRTQGDSNSAFGDGSFFQTRRGSEQFFFVFTVVIAIIFVGTSLANIILTR